MIPIPMYFALLELMLAWREQSNKWRELATECTAQVRELLEEIKKMERK